MRVVSLVPSLTEALFAFGLEPAKDVVGVTPFCVHPRDLVAQCEKIGGTKNPDVAAIVAAEPDVVIANHEENRREDVEALEDAGLRVLVTEIRTVDDAAPALRDVGRAVDRATEADALAGRVSAAVSVVRAECAAKERVPVFVPIWKKPWMTIGGDTFASSVLETVGARNVFGDLTRYPERSPRDARAAGALGVLLPSEPYPFKEKHVPDVTEAGYARDAVRLVDGESLTWYGPRMLTGLPDIASEVAALRDAVTEPDHAPSA